jgi:cytochrome P450
MGVAERYEAGLVWASNPSLFALLKSSPLLGGIRRVPKLGWVVTEPVIARRLLADSEHVSLLGEGGVGHLWAQLLGDWVNEAFDGPGHTRLRLHARDLFTDANAKRHVARVFSAPSSRLTEALLRGNEVDIAQLAREWVGRMVADLLGLSITEEEGGGAYREIFAQGERLAALAVGTLGSTVMPPAIVEEARTIVERLTAGVPQAYESAGDDTLLGRCREAGIPLREARGLASLLLVAGTGTAASAMARGVALLHDTGQQHVLRANPNLMPSAVREVLRVTTPAPVIGRHLTSDVEMEGRHLRAGERVLMLTYCANNAVGRFDVRRSPAPQIRQLWFGAGPHVCLGAPLARAEITYLLQTLLKVERPWRVVRRHASPRVMIPSYDRLVIVCDSPGRAR